MAMKRFVVCSLAVALVSAAAARAGTGREVVDPTRPVARISQTSVTVQYFTAEPCDTRVQIRRGDLPATVMPWRASGDGETDVWSGSAAGVRIVEPGGEATTFHRVTIDGLSPGTRYYYRLYDSASAPTREEMDWGASPPWRREYAVSTLAPDGMRTIIRYPVKVLLMPNVINVESAHDESGAIAPEPERFSDAQMALIRSELNDAARFLFVNSHMRFWPDFHVYVDDRWQRWGPEPENAAEFYKGWPECRSYAGEDYHQPGGGRFTILNTTDVQRVNEQPVREEMVYPGQVEIAFPRRWKPEENRWWYYTSGGGTLGPDSLPSGIPGRSQFFGGYDTCWLITHEFHHQMEALGAISLSFREDDRIVYNHWAPRSRDRGPDAASGKEGIRARHPWSTSGPHGEHYDGMSYWDRTLTDAQWLRILLGETITVVDADGDGFPDDDPRLPLDEKRFGSSAASPATDGRMGDLEKALLSNWAPAPLQVSFTKPRQVFLRPDPRSPDSDRDGWEDGQDPAPLVRYEPFVWPMTATVDGDASEWRTIEPAGVLHSGATRVEFRQSHDEEAWYGCIVAKGPWVRLRIVHDGEGEGVYSTEGIQSFFVYNGEPGRISPTFMGVTNDMEWKTARRDDGALVIEYSFRNWAPHSWFWRRGGRRIGTQIDVYDEHGAALSMYEPYHLFYCTMLEPAGTDPMPADAPGELAAAAAELVLLPGDERLKTAGEGWTLAQGADGGVYRHTGYNEAAVYVDGLGKGGAGITGDFDLWVRIEGKSDGILGAFSPGTRQMGAMNDYIVFVGGYSNTRTRFRLFGEEASDSAVMMSPGEHTMQLSRRGGVGWAIFDGKPILWAKDPHPDAVIDRLAALGGYGGEQVLLEMRVRAGAAE
jgi:hypothetical protein